MPRRAIAVAPEAADAVKILGTQIRAARHEQGWRASDLAMRVGVSTNTILAVEAGAPGTAIGTVLTAAMLVGVPLFGSDNPDEIARMRRRGEERLLLTASRVVPPHEDPIDGSGPADNF